jgi:hypothetical protein
LNPLQKLSEHPLVAADDGENMFAHPRQQGVAAKGVSLVVLKNPARRLIVPD